MNLKHLAFILGLLLWPGVSFAHKNVKPGQEREKLPPDAPLRRVSEHMKTAERHLADEDTGDKPQIAEEKALAILDMLIDAAQKQQKNQRNKQQQQQQQQHRQKQQQQQEKQKQQQKKEDSAKKKDKQKQKADQKQDTGKRSKEGPTSTPEGGLEGKGSEWGTMPPRQRDELIDSLREELPEKYRELLKLYYKRLSESGGE